MNMHCSHCGKLYDEGKEGSNLEILLSPVPDDRGELRVKIDPIPLCGACTASAMVVNSVFLRTFEIWWNSTTDFDVQELSRLRRPGEESC